MRQFADETHGVREQNILVRGQSQSSGGRVERGEQFVLGQNAGAGERVEQGGFAGVRVADDGRERPVAALPAVALGRTLLPDDIQFARDFGDAVQHAAAVGLQLGFTIAAHPILGEARQQMLELGEFDLDLAFLRAGALRKDVEDECGAVEDLDVENLFQVAALRRRKFVVEDDRVHVVLVAEPGKFPRLALADVGRGMGRLHFLDAVADDLAAGGGGQLAQFFEQFLHVRAVAGLEFEADQENAFRPAV